MNIPDGNQPAEPSQCHHYTTNDLARIITIWYFITELLYLFALILMQHARI
jgi:hypothetical protein